MRWLTSFPRGIFVYAVLNGSIYFVMFITNWRVKPREYDLKEYWTPKPAGRKPWVVRALTAPFWHGRRSDPDEDEEQPGLMVSEENQSVSRHSRPGSSAGNSEEKAVALVILPPRAVVHGQD